MVRVLIRLWWIDGEVFGGFLYVFIGDVMWLSFRDSVLRQIDIYGCTEQVPKLHRSVQANSFVNRGMTEAESFLLLMRCTYTDIFRPGLVEMASRYCSKFPTCSVQLVAAASRLKIGYAGLPVTTL